MTERDYENGLRMAYSSMLQKCCGALGYDDPGVAKASWILEREETVSRLRLLCRDFGDNDWDNDLHLADTIEKHLVRHMERWQGEFDD